MTSYLFVYGTLRRGFSNQYAKYLHQNSTFIGEGKMPGQLIDLGSYTGACYDKAANNFLTGEVFKLNEPEKMLSVLDHYEGIGPDFPEPQEYKREQVNILTDRNTLVCWVYLYNLSS